MPRLIPATQGCDVLILRNAPESYIKFRCVPGPSILYIQLVLDGNKYYRIVTHCDVKAEHVYTLSAEI